MKYQYVCVLGHFSHVRLLVILWTVAHQAPLSIEIMIHTLKGFSVVNDTERDVFLELSCFPYDPKDIGNLISDSSAFSISSL